MGESGEARLVDEHHLGCVGERLGDRGAERLDASRHRELGSSNAAGDVIPACSRPRPSVTGPVTCHFTGCVRPFATSRNVRKPPKAS